MIHRLILGARATDAAIAAYNAGLSYKYAPPMDLEPILTNTVRVFSNLDVFTAEDQHKFDAQLLEIGKPFGGIIVRNDEANSLLVIGRALIKISIP
jgi:hypothetical protein